MKLHALALALAAARLASAHIALWDEAMYRYDPEDINASEPTNPMRDLPFSDWWFHGHLHHPPAPGKFMVLPAGGVYHGEVSCNRAFTSLGVLEGPSKERYACPKPRVPDTRTGAIHSSDNWGTPVDQVKDVTGCSISIAYESDPTKIKPEDFTVISTNWTCPWFRQVDFEIPADLPECPEGGCTCMWGWVHSGRAGGQENYLLNYRCKVEGAKGKRALPKPKVARRCHYPTDTSNCTVGAKQPIYWMQLEGNTFMQDSFNPPVYNGSYGFMNGAQTDLFASLNGDSAGKDDRKILQTAAGLPVGTASKSVASTAHAEPTTTPSSGSARLLTYQASEEEKKAKAEEKKQGGQRPKEKAKSKSKVCDRHRNGRPSTSNHRAQARRSAILAEQTPQSSAQQSLDGAAQPAGSRSFVRRMDVVSGGNRWRASRRRDSTLVADGSTSL